MENFAIEPRRAPEGGTWKTEAVKRFHLKIGAAVGASIKAPKVKAVNITPSEEELKARDVAKLNNTMLQRSIDESILAVASTLMTLADRTLKLANTTGDNRVFRLYLMLEELGEAAVEFVNRDEVRLSKELSDLLYVVYGTAVTYDLPIDDVFAEVHSSNMTKGSNAADKSGDRGKGPNYRPADVVDIIKEHREKANAAIHKKA